MGEGFLDRESIRELTQAKQPTKQAQVLARMKIPFFQTGYDAHPKTTWEIVNEILRNQMKPSRKSDNQLEVVNLNLDAIEEYENGKKKNSKCRKPA